MSASLAPLPWEAWQPTKLRDTPLAPAAARWREAGSGHLAILPYDAVRTAPDPRRALLAFLERAYEAGASAAGWELDALASSYCPPPAQLEELALAA